MTGLFPASGLIADGTHRLPVRVYYEDTDAGGIVYHAGYLRFFERGRSECLRLLGIDHAARQQDPDPRARAGFAVRRVEIDYLAPAVLDDALIISTNIVHVGAAFVDVRQTVMRDGSCLARAVLRVALVDWQGRPCRLPAEWRERFENFRRAALAAAGDELE
ncbi:MAG: tol-pal system-associated acyl-CoA thioesterase [Rhodothalassiaceae bacterium]